MANKENTPPGLVTPTEVAPVDDGTMLSDLVEAIGEAATPGWNGGQIAADHAAAPDANAYLLGCIEAADAANGVYSDVVKANLGSAERGPTGIWCLPGHCLAPPFAKLGIGIDCNSWYSRADITVAAQLAYSDKRRAIQSASVPVIADPHLDAGAIKRSFAAEALTPVGNRPPAAAGQPFDLDRWIGDRAVYTAKEAPPPTAPFQFRVVVDGALSPPVTVARACSKRKRTDTNAPTLPAAKRARTPEAQSRPADRKRKRTDANAPTLPARTPEV